MPSIFAGSAGIFDEALLSAGFPSAALLLACAAELESDGPGDVGLAALLELGFELLFDVVASLLQPASGTLNSTIIKIAGLLIIAISSSIPIDLKLARHGRAAFCCSGLSRGARL